MKDFTKQTLRSASNYTRTQGCLDRKRDTVIDGRGVMTSIYRPE